MPSAWKEVPQTGTQRSTPAGKNAQQTSHNDGDIRTSGILINTFNSTSIQKNHQVAAPDLGINRCLV
jgi:hypothetical protein